MITDVCLSFPSLCAGCQGYISSQLVGSIVGLQSEEIKQMAEEYEGKVSATASQALGSLVLLGYVAFVFTDFLTL